MQEYNCDICNSTPDQLSHHKSHLKTQKHIMKRQLFKLQLEAMSFEELKKEYDSTNIDDIINKMETKDSNEVISNEFMKKSVTNKLIYKKSEDECLDTQNAESFKYKFINFLGKMHNLLRGASVTGDNALDDILYCLFLCYLEDKISDTGDFDLANIEKSCYNGIIQRKVTEYVKYLKVSYLLEHTEELRCEGTNSIIKCGKLLSKHPITKMLFTNDNFINCSDTLTLCKLLEECKKFSTEENIFEEIDIIGLAYEYITTKHGGNGGTSKEMGQYFTERPLMEMCFQLPDPEDFEELGFDSNSTLGDEFCATFGFPLMFKKFLKQKYNIDIQDKNMYGVEYHERLSKFAYMNAMFSIKNSKNIVRGNSFITNVTPHLDLSVHNVPFGKSMEPVIVKKNYNGFISENPNKNYPDFKEYIPFNTKKVDAILASQVVLYKTRKMGLMIIKDGEETSHQKNDKYRKWFSENCIIKKIMKIPSGAFSCTGTKTVCIYFIKKEGRQTENIQFLQLSDDGTSITEICNVSVEDMKQNYYSWDSNTYIVDEQIEKLMEKSNCQWRNLGDLINFEKKSTRNAKYGNEKGKYPFFTSSNIISSYVDEPDYEIESVIIGDGGVPNVNYGTKFSTSDHCIVFNSNTDMIKTKWLYYYFKTNMNIMEKYYSGSGIENISKMRLSSILIPIPSIEIQKEIIEKFDDLSNQKQLLIDRQSGITRQMKYYFEMQVKKNEIEIKNLQEIIKINIGSTPSTSNNSYWNNGTNVWVSVSELNNNLIPIVDSKKKITDQAVSEKKPLLVKKGSILMSFKLSIGKLGIAGCDLYTNEAILHVNTENDELNRYLYYHFMCIPVDNNASGCMGGGSLNKEKLKLLNIFIQKDSEKQREIVNYLDNIENKKISINEEISNIDLLMKDIMKESYYETSG